MEDKQIKNRIDYLDLAKAIGITLVVLRHCGISIGIFAMIHMPLFFIISGMFFKEGTTFVVLIKNKTNKLVIPWAFFYILGCLFFYVAASIEPDLKNNYFGFFDVFVHRATFNYPIWYLLCLFWVFVMYFVISKIISNQLLRTVVVIVLALCGSLLGHLHIFLPCYIDTALTSLLFFHIGYMMYAKTKVFTYNKKVDILIGLVLAAVTILAYLFINPKIWLADNMINPLCFIFSTTGVFALLFLIKHVKVSQSLLYIGKHSLVILCWHNFFQRTMQVLLNQLNINTLYVSLGGGVFCCTMFLSILMIPLSLKLIPWFVGKKDIIK